MHIGKNYRLKRFLYPQSEQGLIVPIDHGLTIGSVEGISSIREMKWLEHPAITGVIAHKGIAERLLGTRYLDGKGLMIHVNGMSTLGTSSDTKVMVASVERAQKMGADGISFQVNFDGTNDAHNLQLMGEVTDSAESLGLPVLAMIYDKVKSDEETSAVRQMHLMRIGLELGCDAVKIGIPKQMRRVVKSVAADLPVFIAGGSVLDDAALLDLTKQAVLSGASGLCVGRNIFQRENRSEILFRLKELLTAQSKSVTELPFDRSAYGVH